MIATTTITVVVIFFKLNLFLEAFAGHRKHDYAYENSIP
jgi:hypothetical protein